MPLKIIDNFTGHLTRVNIGEMTSGFAKYATTYGNDPFSNLPNLSWLEAATQIDPTGAVITDLITAAKPNLENGITYVYAIGHTGRVYKIQVNQPSAYNPNWDNPVLLTTLTINSPTFKYGASIQFYGLGGGKIYIGGDMGVTSINFNGTGEAFVGTLSSWVQNIPRPSAQFIGNMYWANGNNIAVIDSTLTVTNYTVLSPALPSGVQVRDLDITPNGNYLQLIGSEIPAVDMSLGTQDTSSLTSGLSYRFFWNGADIGATSFFTFNGYSMNANVSFANYTYSLGYDLGGAAIYSGNNKLLSLPNSVCPNFEALFSTGNMMGFANPETVGGFLNANLMFYGQYDQDLPKASLYRFLRMAATGVQTDIIQIPVCLTVSNLFYGSSSSGYANNEVGSAKLYFSTVETSSAPTTKYKLYKFTTVPTGVGTAIQGVYETQNETSFKLFRSIISKKFVCRTFGSE